ncbi:MAG: glycosyltransferase family 4 protein [Aridibacter sp.]
MFICGQIISFLMKMNILQLGPYPPPRGGVQTNMLAIQDELLENGHCSSIISITKSEVIGDEKNVFHPRSPQELLKLILTLKYDILHLHIGGGLPFRVQMMILMCGLFTRGKSVMTFHSGGYTVSEEGQNASFWTFRGFAFRRFDKIIVVNKLMIEMFEKFGVKSNKIKLIFPFTLSKPKSNVEIPNKFQEFWKNHNKTLITVGLLETDYDLPQQIDVLERLLQKYPKTGLVIIGSGSLHQNLRKLIDSKPYAEHILLAGDTDREVVLHLIEMADLMLRTTIFDGDAISVREALFLGTPVIATDNGMRPSGLNLIPVQNISALEEAIYGEFERKELLSPSNEDGSKNIRDVVELYENVLSSGKENSVKKKTEFQTENNF